MNDLFAIILACLCAMGMGIFLGGVSADAGWKNDCTKLDAHVVDGKVFDCKERK